MFLALKSPSRAIALDESVIRDQPDFAETISRLQSLLSPSRPALRLKNILVPLDFSERSFQSLSYASFLARQFACNVTLLHAVHLNIVDEQRGVPLARYVEEMKLAAAQMLESILSSFRIPGARTVVRVGEPISVIVEEATKTEMDLIILCRRRRSRLREFFSRSITRPVLDRAPCPTLIVS